MRNLTTFNRCWLICSSLDNFSKECEFLSSNKTALFNLYHSVIFYLNNLGLQEVVAEAQKKHAPSNKWPNLILHTIFIHGTFAGLIASTLPELTGLGYLTLSFISVTVSVYFIPLIPAIAYFVHKIMGDISKEERILRVKELILTAQLSELSRCMSEGKFLQKNASFKNECPSALKLPKLKRGVFNSTALETLYLSGSLFPLGVSVIVTLSLSTPVAWLTVAGISIVSGIIYAFYHHWVISALESKRSNLKSMATTVANMKKAVFGLRSDLFSGTHENMQVAPKPGHYASVQA